MEDSARLLNLVSMGMEWKKLRIVYITSNINKKVPGDNLQLMLIS